MAEHRIYKMAFSGVYPLYITKAEKKGRSKDEVDEIIRWLTGYSQAQLETSVERSVTLEDFFAHAPKKHPNRRQALTYLPHPDSDTNEYQQRRFQAHSGQTSSFSPRSESRSEFKTSYNSMESRHPKKYKGGKPVFNSLGKSLNRDTSGEYTPKFVPESFPTKNKKKFRPRPGQKPEYLASSPSHVRSTVFKQRHFGSKVGAKFAAKSKNK